MLSMDEAMWHLCFHEDDNDGGDMKRKLNCSVTAPKVFLHNKAICTAGSTCGFHRNFTSLQLRCTSALRRVEVSPRNCPSRCNSGGVGLWL